MNDSRLWLLLFGDEIYANEYQTHGNPLDGGHKVSPNQYSINNADNGL